MSKTTHKFVRKDGSKFLMSMDIDIDALALWMANKANLNKSKKATQVERTIRVEIKDIQE